METILIEMKTIFEMALNDATFKEIEETPEFNYLEMVMGEIYALTWYEMYIELSTKEEIKEYMKLPIYGGK